MPANSSIVTLGGKQYLRLSDGTLSTYTPPVKKEWAAGEW